MVLKEEKNRRFFVIDTHPAHCQIDSTLAIKL